MNVCHFLMVKSQQQHSFLYRFLFSINHKSHSYLPKRLALLIVPVTLNTYHSLSLSGIYCPSECQPGGWSWNCQKKSCYKSRTVKVYSLLWHLPLCSSPVRRFVVWKMVINSQRKVNSDSLYSYLSFHQPSSGSNFVLSGRRFSHFVSFVQNYKYVILVPVIDMLYITVFSVKCRILIKWGKRLNDVTPTILIEYTK